MPQVEQIQTYYWGPLRADPIELAVDGINVATGPNGSGKTTSLDALKLMFGVSDLSRRPADYIYDGGGEEGSERASRALVKAVFANPQGPGTSGRVFAAAGRGCEASEHVTAICEVTRDGKRRYAMLPGARVWGLDGADLESEINALRAEITTNLWMNSRAWSELLARAGVSKALLGVISVKQGETDKTIEGPPEALLRRVLELTGKQETLEEFRRAKADLVEARGKYDETNDRLTSERSQLRALTLQARQYAEFVELGQRKEWIAETGLPLATRIDKTAERASLANEREGQATALERMREENTQLEAAIPELEGRAEELEGQAGQVRHRDREAQEAFTAAAEAKAQAAARVESSQQLIDAARAVVGDDVELDQAQARARQEAASAARDELTAAEREREALAGEISDLEAGRPARPPELDGFRQALRDRGIESELVAERLEVPQATAAEAVLGDGVWGLVIDAEHLDAAIDLAREMAYRRPIVAAGAGTADGALAGASGLDDAGAYLAEVDLPIAEPGVTEDGVVRGNTWAALRAPARPVLGHQARAARLEAARARAVELDETLPDLRQSAETAQRIAMAVAQAVPAAEVIDDLRGALVKAEDVLAVARDAYEHLADELRSIDRQLGRIESELETKRARLIVVEREVKTRTPQIETYDTRLARLDEEIEGFPPIPDDLDIAALGTVETLTHESQRITERLADEERFPEEVRSELVVAHQDAQERKVNDVSEMLEGRREDLDNVAVEVQRARERYDQHIRQVVGLLARRFREVCDQAAMDGDIELRAGDTEGEFGIDVKVAHVKGDPKRSYRSSAHSSGQRAKISLLILLAAMGLEGSADLLILDEHAAHLDSRNIDAVAEVMNALKHRVQFILATPTNAEAGRLSWCDHQFAFYPRPAGQPFAPPVRLFTRQPVNGERYAEMGQLALAD
jgi:chromosome segregation ATPase